MSHVNHIIKRLADVLFVLVIFPLYILIYGLIAIIFWFCQGRPVLFRQERAGQYGRPFILYKFRTMQADCNPFGPSPQAGSDARLTPLGRILRKVSLDELPQIWNIFKGDMSLVGPRPLYVAQMAEWDNRQKRRLEVKPGLTGLAQI
ncbi:MAG: sugar transferase, partial [Sedimentisphaerales bacterium]|nr:sugar transferase [Sedimentisphaerales bacterium]